MLSSTVREFVERIPGAGWISIDFGVDFPASLEWPPLYSNGGTEAPGSREWMELRERIEDAVASALGRLQLENGA